MAAPAASLPAGYAGVRASAPIPVLADTRRVLHTDPACPKATGRPAVGPLEP